MYALIDENGFFLNHSTLSTMSSGSIDMAWTTEDKEKAELMQERGEHKNKFFKVVEL